MVFDGTFEFSRDSKRQDNVLVLDYHAFSLELRGNATLSASNFL